MPTALIFSSYVASSRVGGQLQALAFSALGVEARLVPTVLFGRHPGWGIPGGGAVGPATFQGVLDGVEAQGGLEADVVLSGYFALPEQVEMAAEAIRRAKALTVKLIVVIDPILGDDGAGLYVKPEVETAVRELLVPLADILAPNLWELRRLTGAAAEGAEAILAAARVLGPKVLVSSVPCGADQIGVLYADANTAWLASHAKAVEAPKGTGDLLKALFCAGLIEGGPIQTVLAKSVAAVADAVETAIAADLSDLPIASLIERLRNPSSRITLSTLA